MKMAPGWQPDPGKMLMGHPEVEGFSEVQEDTFEDTWAPLGWLRAEVDEDGNVSLPPSASEATGDEAETESETAADETPTDPVVES